MTDTARDGTIVSIARNARESKRQMGQFLTPIPLATELVADLPLEHHHRVLEPSFGDGSFLIPLIERFMTFYEGDVDSRLAQALQNNIYGVELDADLYHRCLETIRAKFGALPGEHHLIQDDFFRWNQPTSGSSEPSLFDHLFDLSVHPSLNPSFDFTSFDFIIGNPPFGGTIDPLLQDSLDARYGFRGGEKIKKETYSFFVVKSLDLLNEGGEVRFLCSDTFLTIKTMRGLRRLLMNSGRSEVETLPYFSEETKHPMVLLKFHKSQAETDTVFVNGQRLACADIFKTPNLSWGIDAELGFYFDGECLGDYMIATSGMTVGNNALFLREIRGDIGKQHIEEPYAFEFFDEPITLENERTKARLGKLTAQRIAKISAQEAAGETRRSVQAVRREVPLRISLPHADYRHYNKASGNILSQPPSHVIYWKDEGDAVYTYRKNANWYLHGVGGKKFFLRSGLTWQLIAPRLHTRLLPEGCILDSGAPCAFLRPNVPESELYFVLGWTLTETCNHILKTVINHTRNIQSKDFERLPYPFWITEIRKSEAIAYVRSLVERAREGERFDAHSPEVRHVDALYAVPNDCLLQMRSKSFL